MKNGKYISSESWIAGLVHLFGYTTLFYTLYKVQIPLFFDKGKIAKFIISLIPSTSIIMGLWYAGMKGLSFCIQLHPTTIPESPGMYLLESIQMYVPGMILLAWESYESKVLEENKLIQLEKENLEKELSYLKSQINPQFLFNTLDNLKSLVEIKSSHAPEMILMLSDVLDYVLYKSQKSTVPLKDEIYILEKFINLEKYQLPKDSLVQIKVTGDTSIPISPLTLLSLVEPYFNEKAINPNEFEKMIISVDSNENNISFTIQHDSSQSHSKLNLEQVKRHLNLSYPQNHSIDISNDKFHLQIDLLEPIEKG